MTHDAFAKRLSKLPMLHDVHFGSEQVKTSVRKQLDEELFAFGHAQRAEQLRHFKMGGEVMKLLKLCGSRFNSVLYGALVADGGAVSGDETLPAALLNDWFAFDPTAYALTYEPECKYIGENGASHIVVLATPTLRGLYSDDMEFKTMDDAAVFLDSILIHEIAHCIGSMKHDSKFRKTFKKICKLENVSPVI